jgi:hypothetical protein
MEASRTFLASAAVSMTYKQLNVRWFLTDLGPQVGAPRESPGVYYIPWIRSC